MRAREDILNDGHIMRVVIDNGYVIMGIIRIHGWTGTFVCGFNESGWEHVSVAPAKEKVTPTWNDMCEVKDVFWDSEEECIQIHPKKSQNVNIVKNCLHIWRNKDIELPA